MNDAHMTDMGIEHAADDSKSHGTITPIQQSRRQSPMNQSRDVPSHSNAESLGGGFYHEPQDSNNPGTPERHHKRAANLSRRSSLPIN